MEVDKADMDSGGGDMMHQRTPKKPGIKLVCLKRLPPRKDVLNSCKNNMSMGFWRCIDFRHTETASFQ